MDILFPVLQSDGSVIERAVRYDDTFSLPEEQREAMRHPVVHALKELGYQIESQNGGYLVNGQFFMSRNALKGELERQQRIQSTQGA